MRPLFFVFKDSEGNLTLAIRGTQFTESKQRMAA